MLAFSYAGDIWTVPARGGRAVRLTVHPAYEHTPHWSPDGNWIAFSADRFGDEDVFVIPSAGGQSRRLTYLDSDDFVCDWTHDGKYVLFSANRDDFYPDYDLVYRIPVQGGTPVPHLNVYTRQVAVSREGAKLLYVNNGVHWWRRRYNGSKSGQVWLYDALTDGHTAITDTASKRSGESYRNYASTFPMWGRNGEVYVLTERSGAPNLWIRSGSGEWEQVTDYEKDGIRFPSISAEGETIAYEHGLDIYLLEKGGEPRRLQIDAPLDLPEIDPREIHYSRDAEDVEFAPDGSQIFLELRGEVFATRVVEEELEPARRRANSLSGDHWARDGDFALSPGGDSLIFVSDRGGSRDLYLVYSGDDESTELATARDLEWEKITDTPDENHSPRWSPDSRYIAFVRGKGDLIIFDLKKREEPLLLKGWSLLQYAWSPDGRWIAYAREDNEYNSDIWIIPVEGGTPVNVSRHPDEDDMPVWSADGKKLGFRSRRRNNNWDVYFVFLRWEDHQKSLAEWAEEKLREGGEKSNKDKKKKDDEEGAKEDIVVTIDTTDIYRRIRSVTSFAGEEQRFAISPDGETFAVVANHEGESDLYIVDWTGKNPKRITKGGTDPRRLSFSSDGKRLRYLTKSGRVKSEKSTGGDEQSHAFDAYVHVDPQAERIQKFDEIWRVLKDRFYHPDFHGQDWRALRDKYRPMIEAASCEEDFGDIVRLMMGELNASHMGYSSPGDDRGVQVGRLGLDFDPDDAGPGLLITHVLPYGPCAEEAVKVDPGDRLTTVNGEVIDDGANLFHLLENQVHQPVELTLLRDKKERRVIVRPINRWALGYLRYDEWVQERRVVVDSLSGGRLGYLHIRGMGDGSLARFEAQLYSVGNGKEGLVIDVRYNGGGWTTDYLLAMLQVNRHAVTFPRDGGGGYPQGRLPLYAWTKPIVVICNEHSFSNAEIFSHAIKTLKRGTLVGEPTPGGVISTGWERLLDGSGFRLPMRGWYFGTELERDPGRNMEGNGAVPDVIVPHAPDQWDVDVDDQLESAVEQLMSQISLRKQ